MVVGEDRMCFPVDAFTLEPLRTACYDAHCFSDPEPGYHSHISLGEWNRLRNDQCKRRHGEA